jgi:ubiquinone/menaquinone biosynthesis C-methylase UbiE
MSSLRALHNNRSFDIWAQSYDTQLNPLVMLEERYLKQLLPEVSDRHVLDAGCGSGRWLTYLSGLNPHTLRGIDTSPAMLQLASQKNIPGVELLQCSSDVTPFADHSFDLILSSFVLSYIEDVRRLAVEIDRIARNGCDLFLSDMHPETQVRLAWKRSFRSSEGKIELDSVTHNLPNIVEIFDSLGWRLCATIEPGFSTPEREVFVTAGRLDNFLEAVGLPAIYLLHLQKRSNPPRKQPLE